MDDEIPPYVIQDENRFKISIVGDMNVGKTCLALRFINNNFRVTHRPTISDIETKKVHILGQEVVYQIWDTAGQERFRSLLPLYMKGAHGAIIVYDVTSRVSFDNISTWYTEVQKHTRSHTIVMVVGNKLDIMTDYGCVSTSEGVSLARKLGCLHFEASAKTGENVNELFVKLGEEIFRRRHQTEPNGSSNLARSLTASIRQTLSRRRTETHSSRQESPCC